MSKKTEHEHNEHKHTKKVQPKHGGAAEAFDGPPAPDPDGPGKGDDPPPPPDDPPGGDH